MSEAIGLLDNSAFLSAAAALRASGEMSRLMSAGLQGIARGEWVEFSKDRWERVRNTANWRRWREAVFRRDGYACAFCGATDRRFDPHHIRPKTTCPKRMFDVKNGITLCRQCHTLTFGKEQEFAAKCDALVEAAGVKERQHVCPSCDLSLDRDHNAAINILRLGQSHVRESGKMGGDA